MPVLVVNGSETPAFSASTQGPPQARTIISLGLVGYAFSKDGATDPAAPAIPSMAEVFSKSLRLICLSKVIFNS